MKEFVWKENDSPLSVNCFIIIHNVIVRCVSSSTISLNVWKEPLLSVIPNTSHLLIMHYEVKAFGQIWENVHTKTFEFAKFHLTSLFKLLNTSISNRLVNMGFLFNNNELFPSSLKQWFLSIWLLVSFYVFL